MGDIFTNYLLVILIGLIGWIGKLTYDKIDKLIEEIRTIMLSDVANKKDIDQLKRNQKDHEERLHELEKRR